MACVPVAHTADMTLQSPLGGQPHFTETVLPLKFRGLALKVSMGSWTLPTLRLGAKRTIWKPHQALTPQAWPLWDTPRLVSSFCG